MLDADAAPRIDALYRELEERLLSKVDDTAVVRIERSFDGHLVGQSWDTPPFVPAPDGPIDAVAVEKMVAAFHDTYQARSGNRFDHFPTEA